MKARDWMNIRAVRAVVATLVLFLLAAVSLSAQTVEGIVDAPQLTSVGAVVAAAIFGTAMIKRVFLGVPVMQDVPLWLYVVVLATGLTYLANQVFGTLEGSLWALIWNGAYNGAAASGLYEWVTAGPTKPMQASVYGGGR